MTDNISTLVPNFQPGGSDTWTPEQCLLTALAECRKDKHETVMVIRVNAEGKISTLQATTEANNTDTYLIGLCHRVATSITINGT